MDHVKTDTAAVTLGPPESPVAASTASSPAPVSPRRPDDSGERDRRKYRDGYPPYSRNLFGSGN